MVGARGEFCIAMKPIKFPLEAFCWNRYDERGNVRVEIRDANKNFVFYMSIKGRELQEDNRLNKEIVPMVIHLLNKEFEPKEVEVVTNGNGEKKKRGNPWGRAGRPK